MISLEGTVYNDQKNANLGTLLMFSASSQWHHVYVIICTHFQPSRQSRRTSKRVSWPITNRHHKTMRTSHS